MSLFHRLLVGGLMTLALVIGGGITVSAVWQEPVGAPPGNNVLAPLNQATKFGSSTAAFPLVGSFQNPNSINFTLTPCPSGQTYLSNGTTWACGAAGGSQNLLGVLNAGANASAFTGGNITIGGSNTDTSLMVATNKKSAVWGTSYGTDGANIGIVGAYNFSGVLGIAGGASSYSGYFAGGMGIVVASTLANLPNDIIAYFQNTADHANVFIDAAANKEPNLVFAEGGSNQWSVGTDFTTNRLRIRGADFGTEVLSILPDGKIGVGIVNPSAQLEVKSAAGIRAGYFDGEVYVNNRVSFPGNASVTGANAIMTDNSNRDLSIYAQEDVNIVIDEQPPLPSQPQVGVGDFGVYVDSPATTPLFIVKNNGNVGVGVASPVNKLDVNGKVGVRTLQFASIPAPAVPTPIAGTMYYDSTEQKFRCVEQNLMVVNCVGGSGGSYTAGTNIAIASNAISVIPNPTFAGDVTASSNLIVNGQELNHEALSDFFINSYGGLQLRINRWGGVANFGIDGSGGRLVTVTNAGSLGVGTTNPTFTGLPGQHLTVSDTTVNPARLVLFNNNSTIPSGGFSGQLLFYAGGGNGNRVSNITSVLTNTNENSADLFFSTMNNGSETEKMRITAGGNIGIGTNNPTTKLDVQYTGNGTGLNVIGTGAGQIYVGGNTTGSGLAQIMFGVPGNVTGYGTATSSQWHLGTWADNSGRFFIHDYKAQPQGAPTGSGQTRIMIDRFGNVGLGHAGLPSGQQPINARLEIKKTNDSALTPALELARSAVAVRITDDTKNPELQLQYGTGANDHWGIYANNGNDSLNIWSNNAGNSGDRITVLQDGNVGIGTTTPATKLHVSRRITIEGDSAGDSTSGLIIKQGTAQWNISAVDPGTSMAGSLLFTTDGSANAVTIAPNNNVGIGTFSAPSGISEKLTVNGSGRFTGFVSIHGLNQPGLGGGLVLTGETGSNPRVAFGNQNNASTSRVWIADNYDVGSSYSNVFRIFPQQGVGTNNGQFHRSLTIKAVGTAPNQEGYLGLANPNPQSKLQIGIPNNVTRDYSQIDVENGAPPVSDCDNLSEKGRMVIDSTNFRLYICNATNNVINSGGRSWDYIALTDI